jgi:hypothetical protein
MKPMMIVGASNTKALAVNTDNESIALERERSVVRATFIVEASVQGSNAWVHS